MSNQWDNFCKENSRHLNYLSAESFDYSINISLLHKYIYVETPKAACSTIKLSLQRLETRNPSFAWEHFMDVHNRNFSPLLKPSQTCGFERLLANRDFKIFCFVRNPYTRLLSCYLDKIVGNRPPKKSILKILGLKDQPLSTQIGFEQFIDAISSQSIREMNPHWRPQYYQTLQDSISYNFIGKFESLEMDLERIFSSFCSNYSSYLAIERRHRTDSATKVNNYYTSTLLEKVYNLYQIDFSTFGYNSNTYPN